MPAEAPGSAVAEREQVVERRLDDGDAIEGHRSWGSGLTAGTEVMIRGAPARIGVRPAPW